MMILVAMTFQEVQLVDYGNYCGLGHTNNRGIEPVDELDRACQIHDICTSYGYSIASVTNNSILWLLCSILRLMLRW
jgi:hypothetical protein